MGLFDNIQLEGISVADATEVDSRSIAELLAEGNRTSGETEFTPDLTLERVGSAIVEELKMGVRDRMIGVGLVEQTVEDTARIHRERRVKEIGALQKRLGQKIDRTTERVQYRGVAEEIIAAAGSERLAADPDFQVSSGFVEDQVRSLTQVGQQVVTALAGGPVVGISDMALMITGGTYDRLVKDDVPPQRAKKAAVVNALAQAPLEYIGIGKVTKLLKSQKGSVKFLRDIAELGGVEGLTEYLQNIGPEELTELWAKNPDADIMKLWGERLNQWDTHKTALKGAGHAALSSIIIGGGPAYARRNQETGQVEKVNPEEGTVEPISKTLEQEALDTEADTTLSKHEEARLARKLAKSKVKTKKAKVKGKPIEKPIPKKTKKVQKDKPTPKEKPKEVGAVKEIPKTPEELAELPQEELNKIPTEERAKILLGEDADPDSVRRLAEAAGKLQEEGKKKAEEPKQKAPEPKKVPGFSKLGKAGVLIDGKVVDTVKIPTVKGAGVSNAAQRKKIEQAFKKLDKKYKGKGDLGFVDDKGVFHSRESVVEQKIGTEEELTEGKGAEFRGKKGEAETKAFEKKEAKTNQKLVDESKAAKKLKKGTPERAIFNDRMKKVRGAATRMAKANQADRGDLINTAAIELLKEMSKPKSKQVEKWSAGFAVKNALNEIRGRGIGSRRQAGKVKIQQFEEEKVAATQEIEQADETTVTAPAEEERKVQTTEALAKAADLQGILSEQDILEQAGKNMGVEIDVTKPDETLAALDAAVEQAKKTGDKVQLTAYQRLRKEVKGSILPSKGFDTAALPEAERPAAVEEAKARREAQIKQAEEQDKIPTETKTPSVIGAKTEATPKGVRQQAEPVVSELSGVKQGRIAKREEGPKVQAGVFRGEDVKDVNVIDTAKTFFEGTKTGRPFRKQNTALNTLLRKRKTDPVTYQVAEVVKVEGGFRIKVSSVVDPLARIQPNVVGPVKEVKLGKKRITVDQAIETINEDRLRFDRDMQEALELKEGTPERAAKLEAMAERVARRQAQLVNTAKQNATKAQKRKLKAEKERLKESKEAVEFTQQDDLFQGTVAKIVDNEKGGMDVKIPGIDSILSIPKKYTGWIDKQIEKAGDKIRLLAQNSNGLDNVLTAFVTKFGIDPTFEELEQDKKQSNHTMNVISTRIAKAVERIDDVFDAAKLGERKSGLTGAALAASERRLQVGQAAKQKRLQQIAEGGITTFTEKTVALRLATKEFQTMEKELRNRGMLQDHQFRQLSRKERAGGIARIAEIEKKLADLKLSALPKSKVEKASKKLDKERVDLISRLQIHYKNSGVNYLRHIKGQIEQNDRYMKRFNLDALSNKWSRRRQNWRTHVNRDTGIVTVRRVQPTKKTKKKVPNVAEMVQKGLVQEAHDLHLFDMYSNLAASEDVFEGEGGPWATSNPDQYPTMRYIQMPNNPHFGPLAGMHLEKHIYNDMKSDMEEISEFTRATRKIFRNWKGFKTVWNPATQVRNFISNIALADVVGDVDFLKRSTHVAWKQSFKDFKAVNEGLVPQSKYGKEIVEQTTIHENTFTKAELGEDDIITKTADMLAEATGPGAVANMIKAGGRLGPKWYQMMEVTMKSVVYSAARERGESIQESAALAERALFNYSEVPPGIKWARNYYSPFITFTFKAAPAVARAVVRKPWKLAKYYGLVYGAQTLASTLLDEDEEEIEIKKRNLPDYMDRDMLPGMPSHIRLPFQSPDGKDKYLDLSFVLPWGALSELGEGPLSWVPQGLLPNTPLLTVPAALLTNTDVFTGQPVTLKTDSAGTKIWKIFSKLGKEASPGIIDPNKMSKILGAFYGDENFQGQQNYSVADAVLDYFLGVKIRNMDYMEQSMWRQKDMHKKINEIKAEYKKQYTKISITQENRFSAKKQKALDNIMRNFNDKMENVIDEYHHRAMKENDKDE